MMNFPSPSSSASLASFSSRAMLSGMQTAADPGEKQNLDEEPELTQETDVPIDGPDEVGEAMIRDLPKPVEKPESMQ